MLSPHAPWRSRRRGAIRPGALGHPAEGQGRADLLAVSLAGLYREPRTLAMNTRRAALVADDHGMYRMGLALTLKDQLGFAEVLQADSLDAALALLGERDDIDLGLFDLSMPGMEGAASLAAVRDIRPELRLAVVSASDQRETILEAVSAGVHGYVPKGLSDEAFIAALERVANGHLFLPDSLVQERRNPQRALAPGAAPALLRRLTPRQRDVLKLLAQGKANKEIARALDLGEGTVKIHMAALFRTLSVHNRAAAVAAGLHLVPLMERA
jgi:DNA-binding NarL/FixJ family response regulator